jgi:uncharacterized Fe-S center protein
MKLNEVVVKAPAKMVARSLRAHTTTDEKAFLDKIGTYGMHACLSRRGYIEQYMQTIPMRVKWEAIDKYEIIEHCKELLLKLGGSK